MARLSETEGLAYDDVLLVPQRTSLTSRKEAVISTMLTRNLGLQIPIVSANMDTVTEASMAIAVARLGGLGIVHRYMTISDEVYHVEKVKRSESIVIDSPYTVKPQDTIEEALGIMKRRGVRGLPVVDEKRVLVGILTFRDTLFVNFPAKVKVAEAMTAQPKLVAGKFGISPEDAKKIFEANRLEKLPLVDDQGRLCGLITVKDIIEKKILYPNSVKDKKGRLLAGAAIGVKGDFMERAEALVAAGADVLVLDIAHGHATYAIDAVKKLKAKFSGNVPIIAGNTATYEGTKELALAGADAVKVGVGPGATCTTRLVTGAGVPQFTAICDAARVTQELGVPIIADGGIRKSGDVVKALAAGASTVMIGTLLAGTEESPGPVINRGGVRYKVCRGMASLGAAFGRASRFGDELEDEDATQVVAEGVEALVPYRGSCAEIVNQLIGGLQSGMSYCGARTISELCNKAVFIKITQPAHIESRPHDLERP
ncbi:MAG: IMP dehydrogenase [Elusimicrobia bacterium]|nr:IMP dehydrogenase [Elusimicrobiota bacterium]